MRHWFNWNLELSPGPLSTAKYVMAGYLFLSAPKWQWRPTFLNVFYLLSQMALPSLRPDSPCQNTSLPPILREYHWGHALVLKSPFFLLFLSWPRKREKSGSLKDMPEHGPNLYSVGKERRGQSLPVSWLRRRSRKCLNLRRKRNH